MGGHSSTTTVRKRDPESPELKNMQTGIYNMLAPIIGAPTTYQQTLNDAVSAGTLPTANTKIYQDGRGYYYNTGNADRDVMNGKNGSFDGNQGYYTEEAWYRPEDNGIRQVWHPLRSLDDASYGRGGRKYLSKAEGAKLYEAQNQIANNDWSNSYFGRSWNDLRGRIDQANNAYDAALNAAPGLQGNVLNTADRISALSDTAQAALQPNIDRLNMLAKDTADLGTAEQRALQPNINNINKLSGKLGALGDTIAGATANYQTQSNNLNKKIEDVGDRQGALANTVQRFTERGSIPDEMRRNLMATVNSELNQNTGSALNDLASRGVMNSSVANRSINNLSNAAADAYAKNYLDAYNAVLGGYGQTNNTLASQADTYSKAFSNANQAWNDRLNGYQLAGTQYNNAIGGYNTANQNITQGYAARLAANNAAANQYNTANQNISQGYSNRLNGLNSALNGYQQAYNNNDTYMKTMAAMPQTLAESAWAQYQPVYSYWQALRNSYDNKEDTDTVVKQGK